MKVIHHNVDTPAQIFTSYIYPRRKELEDSRSQYAVKQKNKDHADSYIQIDAVKHGCLFKMS